MWKVAAIAFTGAFMATPVFIAIARRVVHARRERRAGFGGAQDIAMWGSLAMLGFGVVAAVCWGMRYVSR